MVFGRACGATLTTLNDKKRVLFSSMLQLAVCSLDDAVWSIHLALWALELIIKTLQTAVRGSQEAAWTLQRLPGGDQLAAQTLKKLLRSLQKRAAERLGELSEP